MPNQDGKSGMNRNLPGAESDANEPNLARRSTEDQNRDKSVYKYILDCLTDLGISEDNQNSRPNESSIANQWGQKNNRIFIRRVLRSVLPEYYQDETAPVHVVPGLTLGKLVEILGAIQEYLAKKRANTSSDRVPRILTRSEKLKALHKFIQLSSEENQKIGIVGSWESLLQHLFEIITDPINGLKDREIERFYKAVVNIFQSLKENKFPNNEELEDNWIHNYVEILLADNYRGMSQEIKKEKTLDLVDKVNREINRIEFQSGIRQVKSFLADELDEIVEKAQNLSNSFIEHLTKSLVENEILTDEFSVYIKHFEIEKIQPLPLYIKEDREIGLLNPLILNGDEDVEDIKGLEMQFVYKVKVHFYVKLPDNYQARFGKDESPKISSFSENKLEFFEEITGIGSPISHIIAAINRVLLWDIPALSEYLPLVREVLNDDRVMGKSSHSPVWSYTVVSLCKKQDVDIAISTNKSYDEIISYQELAYGEYCGFDLVEVAAKAALHARLRAIKQTGVNAKVYLTQLCHRVEELNAFKKAKSYLRGYPFSLKAMEGYLDATIFKERNFILDSQNDQLDIKKPYSLVAYDAYLEIAEAYLQEGLYLIAKSHLNFLKSHIEKFKNSLFSDLMLAKYEICQFRYHYLTDLDEKPELRSHSERATAIRAATDSLFNAENYLKKRLKKYYKVGESAQSNFHPFFYLLSRVYAHRAKIHIFSSVYTSLPIHGFDALIEPIRLLEKARIYAARDGSAAHYAYWSAYQSWCYIMAAYLGEIDQNGEGFSKKELIDWAKRLIEHSLICYSKTGRNCYQQIKDNGGKITEFENGNKYYEQYGKVRIQVVPLIQELKDDNKTIDQYRDPDNYVLNLDMSILKQINDDDNKSIYLFGTNSSIILFGMGILKLCEEEKDNEDLQKSITKAIRMFAYCAAIADEGSIKTDKNQDSELIYLDRFFHPQGKDNLIRGLYPHRLTQFAALGKIFDATSKAILLLQSKHLDFDWQNVKILLDNLNEKVRDKNSEQTRYNGHLATHFTRISEYFNQLESKKMNFSSLIQARNKVVKDIFRIVRGESDIKP